MSASIPKDASSGITETTYLRGDQADTVSVRSCELCRNGRQRRCKSFDIFGNRFNAVDNFLTTHQHCRVPPPCLIAYLQGSCDTQAACNQIELIRIVLDGSELSSDLVRA